MAAMILLLTAPCAPADTGEDLVFLHYWSGSLSGGINEMARAYNRVAPPYRVRAMDFEHESFKQSILSMLRGGSPPDMFSYWAGAKVQALVDENLLAPIDRVWADAHLDDVFPPRWVRPAPTTARSTPCP